MIKKIKFKKNYIPYFIKLGLECRLENESSSLKIKSEGIGIAELSSSLQAGIKFEVDALQFTFSDICNWAQRAASIAVNGGGGVRGNGGRKIYK